MTKSKLVGERLDDILEDLQYDGMSCGGYADITKPKAAILALFKSIIPEKLDATITSHEWCRGYSDACIELLKKLEEK
mgnify:FL=1